MRKALASPFNMVSPCHPPVESDTKIHYIIYERNVSSVKCSTSSVIVFSGEMDDLSFPFIDLLCFGTHIMNSLQFAENMMLLFVT
jgi:hypothetical protein